MAGVEAMLTRMAFTMDDGKLHAGFSEMAEPKDKLPALSNVAWLITVTEEAQSADRLSSVATRLLARGFPAVPDALQQPTLALGVLLGGVSRVDLAGLAIYHLVCAVCLPYAVRQARHLLESASRFFVRIRPRWCPSPAFGNAGSRCCDATRTDALGTASG